MITDYNLDVLCLTEHLAKTRRLNESTPQDYDMIPHNI